MGRCGLGNKHDAAGRRIRCAGSNWLKLKSGGVLGHDSGGQIERGNAAGTGLETERGGSTQYGPDRCLHDCRNTLRGVRRRKTVRQVQPERPGYRCRGACRRRASDGAVKDDRRQE